TIRITALVEDTARGRDMLAEHGLAFWIEAGPKHVLFDTGQGQVLSHNAHQLSIPLQLTDAVVLSHGHYDHTGGLKHVLQASPTAKVYAHAAAFQAKYIRNSDGTAREIGIPSSDETKIREQANQLIYSNEPIEICPGLFVTGEIPRVTDFEDTGGAFFLDEQCQQPDPLIDDQAMFSNSPRGTVVLLGCAHSGVINTLQYIQRLTDNRPIRAVMGGTHLLSASEKRMDKTISELRKLGPQRLLPAHCTGFAAMLRLSNEFPGRCAPCSVGTVLELEE
ncbi:MAG: MBL fold metallo-hydrolase, partial [Desulfobacteraceae bacterium]|nr:MBL fold metallo-hydrolase [Desulfobacteraceae bacterium]